MSTALADMPEAVELAELFAQPRRDPAPLPGIYYGVEMSAYLAWDAVSASVLGAMMRSPAHARATVEQADSVDNDDTLARIIGTAGHCAVLEPTEFTKRYLRGPAGNWSHKIPKDQVAELRRQNPGCAVLKPYKYDAVLKARDAILAHPAAGQLLFAATGMEVSITWVDAETGLTLKARPDFLIPDWGTIGDLKSAADASPRGFSKAIANFGYHRKAAFYLDGMNALTEGGFDHFVFIAFEVEHPFALAAYELDPFDIAAARRQNRVLLQQWAECRARGEWPAFSSAIEFISLPQWAQ